MKRLLVVFAWARLASAQLDISVVVNGEERRVTGVYSMGTALTGEPIETRFRIRNASGATATLQNLRVVGTGFRLNQEPAVPAFLAPGFLIEFGVRFLSEQAVSDARAVLTVNTASITLLAGATAAPALYFVEDDGSRVRRRAGETVVFPSVEKGTRAVRSLLLENPHAVPLPVTVFGTVGDGFGILDPPLPPLRLAAGQIMAFQLAFTPATSGKLTGQLRINGLSFVLEGVGREPVMPKPVLRLDPTFSSGRQVRVGVSFDATSRADGTGQLRLEFRPTVGTDDPAVQFLPSASRLVPFQVKVGQNQAQFGTAAEVTLQTGTTAGSIRLIAEMGGFTAEATATIPPAPVLIETARAVRSTDILELTLTGFDNTRSAGEVTFSFYDTYGELIRPGPIRAIVTDAFRQYFQNAAAGGMFSLKAVFPTTAPANGIAEVEVEVRNNAGPQRSRRFRF